MGVVSNHTSIDKRGRHLIQVLKDSAVFVHTIFAPEHGFKGDLANGEIVKSDKKQRIISLYGKHKKPKRSDLKQLDVILYDIQDVGCRFYTYISTLGYVMEACAETGTDLIVLDRPTIFRGDRVEGTVIKPAFYSFVGMFPIPVVYGLTIGEFALATKGEKWMKSMDRLNLTVIELLNWDRKKYYQTKRFLPPSPNIPDPETAHLYASLCYLEGTNVSEGRGTEAPFKQFGAPWLKPKQLIRYLKPYSQVLSFKEVQFTPKAIPGKAYKPKFENRVCKGIRISLKDEEAFLSQQFAVDLLRGLKKLHPKAFKVDRKTHFERLMGDSYLSTHLHREDYVNLYKLKIQKDESMFQAVREKYLLY